MNLGTARTELQARGYSRFSTSRCNTWLNAARNAFEDAYEWPWLKATTTGAAPLTISDLKRVSHVVDSSNRNVLVQLDISDVVEFVDQDLTTTGQPFFWYLTSDTVMAVYPVQTASLSVRYVKFSPELSADADTPLIPVRYHDLWVDLAEAWILRYGTKNVAEADSIERGARARLEDIAGLYALQDRPRNDSQLITWASDDW